MNARREKFRDRKEDDDDEPYIKALVGPQAGNKGERRHGDNFCR